MNDLPRFVVIRVMLYYGRQVMSICRFEQIRDIFGLPSSNDDACYRSESVRSNFVGLKRSISQPHLVSSGRGLAQEGG